MEELWFKSLMSAAVPWAFALLTGGMLLRSHRDNKNPLEWSTVDRCLLLIALFCLAGGIVNLVLGMAATLFHEQATWADWTFVRTHLLTNRVFGILWIVLLLTGFWLRRRHPESRAFGHVVIQYNAFSMAGVCYLFGPVTHPGPLLLSMAIGTLLFLLFEPRFAAPWLGTFMALNVVYAAATWTGLIPYAPMYTASPFREGEIDSIYLAGTLIFVLVIFPLMLSLVAYIFARWRDREAKIAEMTTLLKKTFGRYLSADVMKSILEGKDVGAGRLDGAAIRLSRHSAEMTLGSPVEPMTNLKMNLGDVDEKLSTRDFYGKVTGRSGGGHRNCTVRFTSVPPEVDAYFQALLRCGGALEDEKGRSGE